MSSHTCSSSASSASASSSSQPNSNPATTSTLSGLSDSRRPSGVVSAITSPATHRSSASGSGSASGASASQPRSTNPQALASGTVVATPSSPAPAPAPAPVSAASTSTSTTGTGTATGAETGPKVLPFLFDDAQLEDVLVLVADMLTRLTQHNDSLPLHPSSLTRFHSRATPNISLPAYLRRIAKYTSVEKCCMLILLVYIDRVCERMQGFTICGLTVHRFVCAAVLCASKALCDAFNTNEHYSRVGGITLGEMNLLEKEFLTIIDWRLTCSGELLQHYYTSLVRSHPDFVLADPPTRTPPRALSPSAKGPSAALRQGGSSPISAPLLARTSSQRSVDSAPVGTKRLRPMEVDTSPQWSGQTS